ncbi:MAG: NAD(P)-dependent alcohol dehydrogenase [Candidatus Thermoplasmatota archaeon]
MKAFVMKEVGKVDVIEKEKPTAGPNDAIIKPTKGLVCTSDVHTVKGAIGEKEDLTLGHEAVGIVDEIGEEVERFEPGDRVAVGAITPEWGSDASQRGHSSQTNEPLGGWKFANVKDGVFADYFHVNEADANMAHIPKGVKDEEAVYIADMMSTGFAGAEIANIPIGGTVAVFAQGPVGLMATKGAELQGAGTILAVESVEKRKELARKYGAEEIVDFTQHDPVEKIMELTNEKGVDSAIEALGMNETFKQCIEVAKAGGTVSNIGYHGEGEFLEIPRAGWGVGMSEITINNKLCPGGRVRLNRLLRLLDKGKVDPTHMTTHEFKFDEIEEAFRLMKTKEDGIIKPLVDFE